MSPSTLYAGTANGVFKSTDGGASWEPANKGQTGARILVMALDPSNSSIIYTGASGSSNIFVTRLNSSGSDLSYSTFLGTGRAGGIAVDAAGNACVTGNSAGGFPVTDDALRSSNVMDDVFISKLSSGGRTSSSLHISAEMATNSGQAWL
jgi:hypothetical protein